VALFAAHALNLCAQRQLPARKRCGCDNDVEKRSLSDDQQYTHAVFVRVRRVTEVSMFTRLSGYTPGLSCMWLVDMTQSDSYFCAQPPFLLAV